MVSDSLSHTSLPLPTDPAWAEVICVLNSEGAIQFATPAAARFFGYDPAEIVGRPALPFVAPDTYPATIQRWAALRDDPTIHSDQMMLTMITANGRRIPIRATVWRLPNQNEFFAGATGRIQDRQKRLFDLNNVSGRLAINPVLDTAA
jgi:PAS domain S-box-containing protein